MSRASRDSAGREGKMMISAKMLLVGLIAVLLMPSHMALAQSRPVVRIANLDIGPFVPVAYVARLAEKHGIDVKITTFRRGLEAAQALKSGDVDVGVGGVEAAISAIAGGAPAIMVSGVSNKGLAWVGRSDMKWSSIADLKGKKFGCIRGLHELVARAEFEKHGLTASEEPGAADIQLVFIPSVPGLVNAVKLRQVDATTAPEPFPSRAVMEGYAVPLLQPFDTVLGKLPRAVFMRRDFHDKQPEAAQHFVDALVEAIKIFRDQPDLARDFAVNSELKGAITPEDWDLALKNQDWDVGLTEDLVQAHIDQMLKFGMIRQPLKAKDVTDLAMLRKAEKTIGW
jgi:NitT/TauT family transport system substrate-binding protein